MMLLFAYTLFYQRIFILLGDDEYLITTRVSGRSEINGLQRIIDTLHGIVEAFKKEVVNYSH